MKINVDKLMREKEITNKELATLTGLHVKTIREVRKGLTATRYSTSRKIYKVLKEIKNNDKTSSKNRNNKRNDSE